MSWWHRKGRTTERIYEVWEWVVRDLKQFTVYTGALITPRREKRAVKKNYITYTYIYGWEMSSWCQGSVEKSKQGQFSSVGGVAGKFLSFHSLEVSRWKGNRKAWINNGSESAIPYDKDVGYKVNLTSGEACIPQLVRATCTGWLGIHHFFWKWWKRASKEKCSISVYEYMNILQTTYDACVHVIVEHNTAQHSPV